MNGLLGSTLAQALATSDLFGWFCLEQTGEQPGENGARHLTFQPNGPAFHHSVTVLIQLDSRDVILAMELTLARSFLDHRRNAVFADDLAKSFLRNVLPAEAPAAARTLTNEIEFHVRTDRPVITGPRETPPLPKSPSPAYQCYRGTRPSYEARFAEYCLHLENREANESKHLTVSIKSGQKPSRWAGFFRRLLPKRQLE